MSRESLHNYDGEIPESEIARRKLVLAPKIPTIEDVIGPEESEDMGRAAIPAALKLATARNDHMDAGGRPINAGPFEHREVPDPPSQLDATAREEWLRVGPMLQSINLMKLEDRAAFTGYCMAWSRLINSKSQNEWLAASREVRAWCVQFGFTPASEQKLPNGPDADDNPFD